jgi:hypothetical protein
MIREVLIAIEHVLIAIEHVLIAIEHVLTVVQPRAPMFSPTSLTLERSPYDLYGDVPF